MGESRPVGSQINNQGPFDHRTYGFSKLSDSFAAIDLFEIKTTQDANQQHMQVRLKQKAPTAPRLCACKISSGAQLDPQQLPVGSDRGSGSIRLSGLLEIDDEPKEKVHRRLPGRWRLEPLIQCHATSESHSEHPPRCLREAVRRQIKIRIKIRSAGRMRFREGSDDKTGSSRNGPFR